jgi:putative copper export protein
VKILLFLFLATLSFMLRASYKEIAEARSEKEGSEDLSPHEIIVWRIRMIEQFEVWTAIIILLVVSVMQVY